MTAQHGLAPFKRIVQGRPAAPPPGARAGRLLSRFERCLPGGRTNECGQGGGGARTSSVVEAPTSQQSRLVTDRTVYLFPQEIGVPIVPGILLDHVGVSEAHVELEISARV